MQRRLGILALLFFCSGAAALLFETLWFRLAGLTFGNAAWATAVVLASFMAGLALGNVIALRLRVAAAAAPLRIYALIEACVGVTGFALVQLLPSSTSMVAPLFRAIGDQPLLAGAIRFAIAFLMMLVPTALMGATLPALVGGLSSDGRDYGRILGLLYGCNTLGAVAGALAGELVLIEALGLRGTAAIAFLCSVTAAAGAFFLSRRTMPAATERATLSLTGLRGAARGIVATAIAGFLLLALEVVWMRLLVLFVFATSLAFALMLAVILFGIGAGALLMAEIDRRIEDADRWTPLLAALAAIALVASYDGFASPNLRDHAGALLVAAARLMLPVSFLSGMLFPSIGRQIERSARDATFATAALTAANTIGGMLGSILATFVLIPRLGVDGAIVLTAAGYVIVALLTMRRQIVAIATIAVAAIVVIVVPKDLMIRKFIPAATASFRGPDTRIVAVEQGPIETAIYIERSAFGVPYVERLYTNGYSMSATTLASKRYMSLFVHLPVALKPSARSALLISYGVGVTAHALTSTPQLQSIDVVDISRTILGLSHIVWPGDSNPLRDPRVRVHVDDGRFFLLTTPRRFDLITAEPPPPKCAGVVNLYTKEYFALLRSRLTEGGLATYWLPVYQLEPDEARAITGAFCSTLDDCSLWSGAGGEWILLGSRGPMRRSVDPAAPWRSAASADWLARAGIERPEMLGSLFLADTAALRAWSSSVPPLTDDFPLRLSNRMASADIGPWLPVLDGNARERRFASSELIRRVLPPDSVRAALPYFGVTSLIDRTLFDPKAAVAVDTRALQAILTRSDLRDAPRIILGSNRWLEDLARRARTPDAAPIVGIGELCDRHYAEAAALLGRGRDTKELAAFAQRMANVEIADRFAPSREFGAN